jgi:hypothetical protein
MVPQHVASMSRFDTYGDDAAGALRGLINGYQATQAIHVAAVLGIADHMTTAPRASDEIAAAVGAVPGHLYRLLRALAALGVFREHEGRAFSLAPMGECLRADAARPLGPFAVFVGQDFQREAWGKLLEAVRTGAQPFAAAHGMTTWQYRERHPEAGAIFDAAMTGNSRRVNAALVAAYPFDRCTRVADIGGGHGSLLASILVANPHTRGILFDQPHVVSGASDLLDAAGVTDRTDVTGGDMFEVVPGGCDTYVLKYILHDWDDDQALRILNTCARAMPVQAALLVIERFVGPPNEDAAGKLADLTMLVGPGGRERTQEELADLLHEGGFRVDQVIATGTPLHITVARRSESQ